MPGKNIKVSVIIPVFNAEKYINRCVKSVLNQSLKEIEIICIDDGSSDRTLSIINELAKNDSRLRIIHQKNSGVSVARNKGLEAATGEYIGFVDSDDYVDQNYFEYLYLAAQKEKADIARANVRAEMEEDNVLDKFKMQKLEQYDHQYNVSIKELIQYNKLYQKYVIWLSIFKREMLLRNNIYFSPKIRTGQDVVFNIQTGYYADKIVFVDTPVYYRRVIRQGSLMSYYAHTSEGLVSRALVLEEVAKFLNKASEYPEEIYVSHIADAIIFIYDRLSGLDNISVARDIAGRLSTTWRSVKYKNSLQLEISKSSKHFAEKLDNQEKLFHYIVDFSRQLSSTTVSVIIPVYNTEKYLRECLDSVLNQTLGSIEVICIDDGSTDNSLSILNEYASRDDRIIVLNQKNKGAGVARNKGISLATGKYLYFLDSDDYIDRRLIENVYFEIQENKADIAVFRAAELDVRYNELKELEWVFDSRYIPKKQVFNHKDMAKHIFNTFANVPWNKMYSRKFIDENKLLYQETLRTNDLFFTCRALILANRIITISDSPMVFYRTGTLSNSQATNDIEPLGFYRAFIALKNFLEEQEIFIGDIKQSFLNHALDGAIYNLNAQKTYQGFELVYNTLKTENVIFNEKELSFKNYVYPQYQWAIQDLKLVKEKDLTEYLFISLQRQKERNEQELIHIYQLEKSLRTEQDFSGKMRHNYEEVLEQLTQMYMSRSWRLTKPLRELTRPLKTNNSRKAYNFTKNCIKLLLKKKY